MARTGKHARGAANILNRQTDRPLPICTYCEKGLPRRRGGILNQEHAVGRQFFPEPRPADLSKVIVPSCRACNEKPKPDEDYLRALLSLSNAALTPSGKRVHETAIRAMKEGKDKGLRRAIARGITPNVHMQTESGVYLGRAMTQTIDWKRVACVLEKWVRGLHWKEYGSRLPAEITFEVARTPDVQTRTMVPMAQPSKGSWPGTFEYWHSRDDADPTKTKWVFLVWDAIGFIAVTNQSLAVLKGDVFL